MSSLLTIKCNFCGTKFKSFKSSNRKYCSLGCHKHVMAKKYSTGKYKKCLVCKKEFYVQIHRLNDAKYCSIKCSGKTKVGMTPWNKDKTYPEYSKEKSSNWRGGRTINSQGYVDKFLPEHPHSDSRGYYKEHRYNVERYLNRILLKSEQIHHINKDKQDNRVENLYLFSSNSEHRKFEGLKNKYKLISNIFKKS